MDDMNNLEAFLEEKVVTDSYGGYGGFTKFSIDDLKELRYLASLALVEQLVVAHKSIMTDIFKEN